MNTLQLKNDFHKLIDSIDNENLLSTFYHLLKTKISGNEGKMWKSLTKEKQEELLMAFEESKNRENLISHEEMKKKLKKWKE